MVETMSGVLAIHRFTMEDQARFALLSHDSNPMHVDPLAARRTQYGFPVVHGVHALLWALDALFRQRPEIRAAGLQVRFVKPMLVGDSVSAAITAEKPGDIAVTGSVAGTTVMTIRLTATEPRNAPGETPASFPQLTPLLSAAHDLPIEALPGRQGMFRYEGAAIAAAFPAVAAALGVDVVTGLAAATYVVGMECPGLHSIFSGITAALRGKGEPGVVHFEVTKVDPRFRVVDMALRTAGFTAAVGSFARMPPVQQADFAQLASRVDPQEFAGQQALIIGGSRGIGEITAKLLAAGGAKVAITYAHGQADAQSVCDAITGFGGQCEVFQYDANQPSGPQIATMAIQPTHVYYFATSRILARRTALFDAELFRQFCHLYLTGFHALGAALLERAALPVTMFFPSSTFINEQPRDFSEYVMAKAAGEALCRQMSRHMPGLRAEARRLPRVLTDQTAAVVSVETESPLEVMLPILRELGSPA